MTHMASLIAELRRAAQSGALHLATIRSTHCDACSQRMPCDTKLSGELASDALHEIVRLRDFITELDIRTTPDGTGVVVAAISTTISLHPAAGPLQEWLTRIKEDDK